MKTDMMIERESTLLDIREIAKLLNIDESNLELYGKYKAKISPECLKMEDKKAKLILVTAITPTKAGEGKTTVSISLAEGMNKIGLNCSLALREPSLGPVMGLKGGATGGGYAQVAPMADINLHFTGDFHAITSAVNLISAVIDNELYYGNKLNIDKERIVFKRALDVNDRSLRSISIGQGSKFNGVERTDSFQITVASEIMAVFCLARDFKDLEDRLNRIIVAYSLDGNEIYLKDLGITGSLLLLLKDAFKPNLVQTIENTPAIIHGGPFANIAHGCNSYKATEMAMHLSDYVVTEAGFGADLGCEKFLDIKARTHGLTPSVVVLVATIRALKMHGGVEKDNLKEENVSAMLEGTKNLERHINTIKTFNLPYIVAINKFYQDTDNEIEALENYLKENNHEYALSNGFMEGGNGTIELAQKVKNVCANSNPTLKFMYEKEDSIKTKILKVATKVYGAKDVEYTEKANSKIEELERKGFSNLLICMAKTQNSVSDDATLLNAPKDFTLHVKDVSISNGAGFIVVYTGKIITMPGLPEDPACKHMGFDSNGDPYGIF